jgi:hypothetical protein
LPPGIVHKFLIFQVQSKGFWKWIKKSFDKIKRVTKTKDLFEVTINKNKALVASFTHPSSRNYNKYNWGSNDHTPYLLKTVKPTIKYPSN